ncbi:branched-chain amino acid ABC transporter substrate-binding protein [Paraburkholderia sp. MM5482-R1]|uniref:branched-chain amino acid ABC transporter substrate-binding protein n=1 Tax=Paraburkholderia sp. MM5482-R1 TaxID=2991063 RepID=UPI003D1A8858
MGVAAASFVVAPGIANAVQVVKIGMSAPLTGGTAALGKDTENGVRLAIDEANAQHLTVGGQPVQFELDSVDDQGDPRIGVQVAQKLVDDGVAVVIGPLNSGVCLPTSSAFTAAGIPMMLASATNPEITRRGMKTIFRMIPTDAQNAGIAGNYAVTVTKAERIAVMDDRTAFGQGEAEEFIKAVKAAGGQIVDQQYTNDKAVDFRAQLTHMKSSNADLVYFGGLDNQAGLVIKQMKMLGMRAQFLGGGAVADTVFTQVAGPSAEGALAWEYGRPLNELPRGTEFADKYKHKFGTENLTYSPFAYDATWLAIDAMKKAGSAKPAAFVPAIRSTDYEGITGKIAFDSNGDQKSPMSTLYQVKDGKWQPVKTVSGN